MANVMVTDAGFVTSDALGEIDRAIITLHLTAEDTTRLVGDVAPFAASPRAHARIGFTVRDPIGIVCAITPFDSPLNTVIQRSRLLGSRQCRRTRAIGAHAFDVRVAC